MQLTWWVYSFLGQDTPAPRQPGPSAFLPLAILAGVVVFMIMTARSQRKREERERQAMYARLAKNDRVVTAGGIVGTVVTVKDDEVVVKVDESTNTKMTFLKTAIQRILSNGASAGEKG